MKRAIVHLTKDQKAVFSNYIGESNRALGQFLKESLIKANEIRYEDIDRYIFYRPVLVGQHSITTVLTDSEFYNLVDKPSDSLGVTQHSYVSSVFFNYAKEIYNISEPNIYDNELRYKQFSVSTEQYTALCNLKKITGITFSNWISDTAHKYSNNSDLLPERVFSKGYLRRRKNYVKSLSILINQDDLKLLKSMSMSKHTTMTSLIRYFIQNELIDSNENYSLLPNTTDASNTIDITAASNTTDLSLSHSSVNTNAIEIFDASQYSNDFFKSLLTTITVYDSNLKIDISRTFSSHLKAKMVYDLIKANSYDLLNCKKTTNYIYGNISVTFSDSKHIPEGTVYSDDLVSF